MLRHDLKIWQILLILLILAVNPCIASADGCKISAKPGANLRIPVALSDQVNEIDTVEIKIRFDKDMLNVTKDDVTLTGGILNDEDYTLLVNPDMEKGELTLVIYSIGNLNSGSGELLFINFEVIGKSLDTSALSLTDFTANLSPASGGFYINNTFCQCAKATVLFDTNNDGRTGVEEAIHALQCASGKKECDPDDTGLTHAIYALQTVSGIKRYHDINNDCKTGTEEAIYALQCASGEKEEYDAENMGLGDAIYALGIVSGMK